MAAKPQVPTDCLRYKKTLHALKTFLFASNPKIENQRSMVFYDKAMKIHSQSRFHPYKKFKKNNKKLLFLKMTFKISKIV